MKENKKYYKVIYCKNDKYYSVNKKEIDFMGYWPILEMIKIKVLEYKINKYIKEKEITIFNSKNNAIKFNKKFGGVIFECLATDIRKPTKKRIYQCDSHGSNIKYKHWPKGTLFANSVKLIKEIL